jgi:hypothetical protein
MTNDQKPAKVKSIPERLRFVVHRVTTFSFGRAEVHAIATRGSPHINHAEITLTIVASSPVSYRAGQTLDVTIGEASQP